MVKRNINSVRRRNLPNHVMVFARAGTGKTTHVVQGLRGMMGLDPCVLPDGTRITPTEEQEALWAELAKSKGAGSITVTSFGRSIANELKRRVPKGVRAKTTHGLGYGQIHKRWDLLQGDDAVNPNKVYVILEELVGSEAAYAKLQKENSEMLAAVNKIVGLLKSNLLEPTEDNIQDIVSRYDIDCGRTGNWKEICKYVPDVIEVCMDPSKHRFIDFNDMVWLPVVHKLNVWRNDLLCVDEAQDNTPCQNALIQMAAKRLFLIGDDWQSIYGFAGADTDGMKSMYDIMDSSAYGAKRLLLNETYRCSKAVTKDAQELVKDFVACSSNPEGASNRGLKMDKYQKDVQAGDMVLCRVNAPLVSQCFQFIKDGRKANIAGRNIGDGLVKMIDRFKARDVPSLITKVEKWHDRETKKEGKRKFPNDNRLVALSDKRDCLLAFTEGRNEVIDVKQAITRIFKDPPGGSTDKYDGILLSSGHKSKGLEANNVFFLEPDGATCPHPMARTAEAKQQELHLRYVMMTRAKNSINYVS